MTRVGLVAVLSIGLLCALGSLGHSQEQRGRGNDACTRDAARLCKKFFGQGDFVILSCFQANARRLSPPCRKFLTNIGQLH
jgi:hypothetical protein